MPPLHLLIKPASGLCNLSCKYCFYQRDYGLMSTETLENVVRKSLDYAQGDVTFAFQGGEPTLAGLEFFKLLPKLVSRYNTRKLPVSYAIQTNGINQNEEWAKFYKEHNFLVGLSLDGIKDTHDLNRVDSKGRGSFSTIMNNTVEIFNKFGVQYNILTVVNASTARRIEKIYNFYRRNNLRYLQFIPCLDPLEQEPFKNSYSLTPQTFEYFLKTLFDLWYRDISSGEFIYIRQFENYIGMMLGYPPESCGMYGICSSQNVVEADGTVYPCDFYVYDHLALGNLNTDDFDRINTKRKELKFIEDSALFHPKCKACKHKSLCRGGCRRNREPFLGDNFSLNHYCDAYYAFFEYSMVRMAEICRKVTKR